MSLDQKTAPAERAEAEDWKGRSDDADAERTLAESDDQASLVRIRRRSFHLLGWMLNPHKRAMVTLGAMLVVGTLASLAGPFLAMLAIDHAIPQITERGSYTYLIWIAVAFALISVVYYASTRLFIVYSAKISQEMLARLRKRVFRKFQQLSVSFHERFTSGRVVSRQTSDMESINELASQGAEELIVSSLSIVVIGAVLAVMDPVLALAAFVAIPCMIVLARWFSRVSAIAYRRSRETVADLIVYFVESMGGIKAVQSYRREDRDREIFHRLNQANRYAQAKGFKHNAKFGGGTKLIGNAVIVGVLLFGGWRVMNGDTEIGVLAAFVLYLKRFFDPIQELAMFYNTLQSGSAALEKLSGVLDEPVEVADPERPEPLGTARGEVVFTDVEFRYRDDEVVLPGLNLTVPAGQTVAMVGATGAGKTTIAKLVSRFYDPNKGRVELDGRDLRDLSDEDLRANVVLITQENFLFDGTIAENIELGRPGADREEIERAAKVVGADEFVRDLPEGFDTHVKKRGGRLSAGQRQLVVFARAVLADPRVLILDEATSSLDIPSERLVQRALKTILADRTAVIIAHRLSTVEIADRVLVLDSGRITEDGSPSELTAGEGGYARLHRQWEDSLV
ncbi:ABC transporter ATP-binding protein [Salininema proteolyticum]|uniref:ABC transporter ATP-binding protein n=1 Tax=Salininema proteolyticum TaxID=1607685 RepID=A0ABV8TV54_9ACTN